MSPVVLGQGLVIEHKELSCVVADKFPRLIACIEPGSRVARARVYFRAVGRAERTGVRGRVVLNGTEAFFPGPGPSRIDAYGQSGYNHLEASLVEGQGKRGTWSASWSS
jgi:hypothetical protein